MASGCHNSVKVASSVYACGNVYKAVVLLAGISLHPGNGLSETCVRNIEYIYTWKPKVQLQFKSWAAIANVHFVSPSSLFCISFTSLSTLLPMGIFCSVE